MFSCGSLFLFLLRLVCTTDDTAYAKGYSEEKFNRIEVGMTTNKLCELMGEPVHITPYSPRGITYYYDKDGCETGLETSPLLLPDLTIYHYTYDGKNERELWFGRMVYCTNNIVVGKRKFAYHD